MKNDIRDVATVTYNAEIVKKMKACYGDLFDNARDLFVNGNLVNRRDIAQDEFEAQIKYNKMDTSACPVIVYLNGNKMLAWYDEENEYGYIA